MKITGYHEPVTAFNILSEFNIYGLLILIVPVSDGATGGLGGTYPPLFENMGRVISLNLQTRAYGARERPPVSPDYRVPPTSKHLAPSLVPVLPDLRSRERVRISCRGCCIPTPTLTASHPSGVS